MSDHIDTRDGWREARFDEALSLRDDLVVRWRQGLPTYWVREEPVPPLPTEPYTVIRATWPEQETAIVLDPQGEWHFLEPSMALDRVGVERITGFKVLAQPKFDSDGRQITMSVEDHHREMRESQQAWQTVGEAAVRHETAQAVLDRVSRDFESGPWRIKPRHLDYLYDLFEVERS